MTLKLGKFIIKIRGVEVIYIYIVIIVYSSFLLRKFDALVSVLHILVLKMYQSDLSS